ncbi:hypothetical protein C2E23DRAFT_850824 [Lenzites betulinus]|nr:hypothetical protein C2E23DRAFT_850824 [Lenzites betulinus]
MRKELAFERALCGRTGSDWVRRPHHTGPRGQEGAPGRADDATTSRCSRAQRAELKLESNWHRSDPPMGASGAGTLWRGQVNATVRGSTVWDAVGRGAAEVLGGCDGDPRAPMCTYEIYEGVVVHVSFRLEHKHAQTLIVQRRVSSRGARQRGTIVYRIDGMTKHSRNLHKTQGGQVAAMLRNSESNGEGPESWKVPEDVLRSQRMYQECFDEPQNRPGSEGCAVSITRSTLDIDPRSRRCGKPIIFACPSAGQQCHLPSIDIQDEASG